MGSESQLVTGMAKGTAKEMARARVMVTAMVTEKVSASVKELEYLADQSPRIRPAW